MSDLSVSTVTRSQEKQVIALMTLSFASDPPARWVYPDPDHYLTYFPIFVQLYGGGAFDCGGAHTVGGDEGCALWLSPGMHPHEAKLAALIRQSVPAARHAEIFDLIEQMGSYYSKPHWFLPLIGIDPRCQGKGRGSALLQHMLAQCDRDGHMAYLNSSNPKNVPLYQRYGFEVIGTIKAGSCPPIYPMLRKPRQ
jgi:ribosomal protein S18 acetylase RimI-like enzyme